MSPKASSRHLTALALTAAALLGLVPRFWGFPQLGLMHFDEGIYALAGLWSLSPSWPPALDPGLIPYAPPGYPILVGLAYAMLGPSDAAAVVVSVACGVLTIPLVGWLTSRAFGPSAGIAAAVWAALSGLHIAFSRMALTDATFLLVWVAALAAGVAWIARPNGRRALLVGLLVGLAQNVKYNGWLAGVIVALATLPSWLSPQPTRPSRTLRMLQLMAAGLLALLLYLPWFQFVERHGGYSGLLAHQASYVQGPSAWFRNLGIQLGQVEALSGGPDLGFLGRAGVVAAVFALGLGLDSPLARRTVPRGVRVALLLALVVGVQLVPSCGWWIGAMSAPRLVLDQRPGTRLVAVGWLVMAILTPLYHPYARLWLPLQALSWALAAGWLAGCVVEPALSGSGSTASWRGIARAGPVWSGLIALLAVGYFLLWERARPLPGLLAPSDSLRVACRNVADRLNGSNSRLPILARPSVLFYLGGRVGLARLPDAKQVQGYSGPSPWLLMDETQWRQEMPEARSSEVLKGRWRADARWPTPLNLPTLLDVDPGAATSAAANRDDALILYALEPSRALP